MYVIDAVTAKRFEVKIDLVRSSDFKNINKKEYFFDWRTEQEYEIYKISRIDRSKIIGLVSIERIPSEWRIHIRLLSVSKENKGSQKMYHRIVGNLLTYISKLAIKDFAELACVSLKPKSSIAKHYMDEYGMNLTGATLSLELKEIFELIKEYDNDK